MFHQQIKKYPSFQGIQSFIPVFKKARNLSPSRTTRIQSTTFHPIYLTNHFNIIPILRLGVQVPSFFRFPHSRRQYALALFTKWVTWPAHSYDLPYIELLNFLKHYHSKKVSTASDATTQHEMLTFWHRSFTFNSNKSPT